MANVISVVLKLIDNLNPALSRMGGNLTSSIVKGNLLTSAINTGFQVATSAVGAFTGAIKDAADAQQSLVMTVGAMQTVTRGTYEEAEELTVKLQSRLAQRAAVLPGETEDYIRFFRQVADDIGLVNREMNNGQFDAEEYGNQIDTVVSKFQVLGAQPGLTRAQVVNTFQSIMGGQSLDFLGRLEFFRNNPLFANSIRAAVADMGKELEDMSRTERFQVLVKALDVSVTDETIERLNKTLTGMFAGLKTKIFDPNIGLFGLSRDLNLQLEGQQTVIQALTDLAWEVFGSPDSLLNNLVKLFQNMGLGFDPMTGIYNGLNSFTKKVKEFSQLIAGLNALMDSNTRQTRIMRFIQIRIGGFLKEFTNNLARNIEEGIPVLVEIIKDGLIASYRAADFIESNIDEGEIVAAIGKGITQAIINQMNFDDMGDLYGLMGMIAKRVFYSSGFVIVTRAAMGLGQTVGQWFWDIATNITKSLVPIGSRAIDFLGRKFNDVVMGVYKVFDFIADGVERILDFIVGKIANVLGVVRQSSSGLDSITGMASQFFTPGSRMGGREVVSPVRLGVIRPRFDGQIPNAADGFLNSLLGAVFRESQAMPAGESPVVANTSEAILNRAQQAALGQAMSIGRQVIRGDLSIGAINFPNVPNWTPEAVADYAIARIMQEWEQFSSSKLSSLST